jgi:4-hydroxy-tetrahydrodipicolinate reductase
MPINVAIAGIDGRMGKEVAAVAELDPGVLIQTGLTRSDHIEDVSGVDVLIDFTVAESTIGLAEACATRRIPFVSGVTGLSAKQANQLLCISETIPVFYSRNFSIGISALLRTLPEFASALDGYDIEVVETHHRHKVDSPSGTALALVEALRTGQGQAIVHGREGVAPRQPGEIGIHSIRGGGNTGEHTVIFMNDGEEIRIGHRALSRRTFALGALRAAHFVVGRSPGYYGMDNLLGN